MSDYAVVKKTVDYIENHLNEDLSLDKLAEELCYSKFYIARTFAENTGSTVYQYIRGRRLTQAARELVETEKPVVEIAYEAHYNSQQAFTLAFHKLYQCPPQTYRKIGVFEPKQSRIVMKHTFRCLSGSGYLKGGRIAA